MDLLRPYYNQAKEIAKHFSPYNPEDTDLLKDNFEEASDIEQDSEKSSSTSSLDMDSNIKPELDQIEQEIIDSQFTLVGSSKTNLNSDTSNPINPKGQPGMPQSTRDDSDILTETIEPLDQIQPQYSAQITDQTNGKDITVDNINNIIEQYHMEDMQVSDQSLTNKSHGHKEEDLDRLDSLIDSNQIHNLVDSDTERAKISKNVWADNMVRIMDQYLIEEESVLDKVEMGSLNEMVFSHSLENLSKAESVEPLYNTPASEYLDFYEVSRQISELDPQFNQSEAFYAEQCAAYWDARGWLTAIENNECDDEILDSIEYHKRILLDRVKNRLEVVKRDQINRELLHKASSFLEVEEICKQIAEEAAIAKDTPQKESILNRFANTVLSCSNRITESITSNSKVAVKYSLSVGGDILASCNTFGTELIDVIFGNEFSIIEYGHGLTKLTPKDILHVQQQIFSETVDIVENIVLTWWHLRLSLYKLLYSTGKTLISSSISALSQSTSPGSRLSVIISKFSGLFRS